MFYSSTRGSSPSVKSAQAIASGIAGDGGLFVPESFPAITPELMAKMLKMDYKGRAKAILSLYLDDFSESEISACVEAAYTGNFENDCPAPVKEVTYKMNLLELWHGPTCAFKDMALQLLPHLLTASAKKAAPGKTMVILVATSGDTGKAALEGFADVPGTKIIVFFPVHGVSAMQKLQMTTQAGNNVAVCAIEGNFDDAQTGVKNIFADSEMKNALAEKDLVFSSANSINFGRLAPQIVYYVSAYCDLVNSGRISCGDPINAAVPTGNFGNILAAVYAKKMGLPIAKFICASNSNNVLTDFLETGVYDRNRKFFTTSSPSMDILISSNLERMLHILLDSDTAKVAELMDSLKKTGRYEIGAELLKKLQAEFFGGFCNEDETRKTIMQMFENHHYLCDPHTAVAVNVYNKYRKATGDDTPVVIASTASPYKFAPAVLQSIAPGSRAKDEFELVKMLNSMAKLPVPEQLASLKDKEVIHTACVEKQDMKKFIGDFLDI